MVVHELSSDHLPILTGIQLDFPMQAKPTRNFFNYRKADWVAYTQSNETSVRGSNISNFPSVDLALDVFNRALTAASKANIPANHVRGCSSSFTPEIKALILQKKHLRSQFLTQDVAERIRLLSTDISAKVRDHAESLW